MKTIIVRKSNTYPDIVCYVDTNEYGDQIIELYYEPIAQDRTLIGSEILTEFNHLTPNQVSQWIAKTVKQWELLDLSA